MDTDLWCRFLDELLQEKGRLESELSEAQSRVSSLGRDLEGIGQTEAFLRAKLGSQAEAPTQDASERSECDAGPQEGPQGAACQDRTPVGHRPPGVPSHAEVAEEIL